MFVRAGFVLVALAAGVAAVAVWWFLRTTSAPPCQAVTLTRIRSPDRVWEAVVREETCSDGAFTTSVADIVALARPGGPTPADGADAGGDVFSLEEGGHEYNRPVLRWIGPREIEITVPNKSLIGLNKTHFGDVTVRVRFVPNDPGERQRWLKQVEKGP